MSAGASFETRLPALLRMRKIEDAISVASQSFLILRSTPSACVSPFETPPGGGSSR